MPLVVLPTMTMLRIGLSVLPGKAKFGGLNFPPLQSIALQIAAKPLEIGLTEWLLYTGYIRELGKALFNDSVAYSMQFALL